MPNSAYSIKVVSRLTAVIGIILVAFVAIMMYMNYRAPVIREGYVEINASHLKRYKVEPTEGSEFAIWANDGHYSVEDMSTYVEIQHGFIEIIGFEQAEETLCTRIREDFYDKQDIKETPWDDWRERCFPQHP